MKHFGLLIVFVFLLENRRTVGWGNEPTPSDAQGLTQVITSSTPPNTNTQTFFYSFHPATTSTSPTSMPSCGVLSCDVLDKINLTLRCCFNGTTSRQQAQTCQTTLQIFRSDEHPPNAVLRKCKNVSSCTNSLNHFQTNLEDQILDSGNVQITVNDDYLKECKQSYEEDLTRRSIDNLNQLLERRNISESERRRLFLRASGFLEQTEVLLISSGNTGNERYVNSSRINFAVKRINLQSQRNPRQTPLLQLRGAKLQGIGLNPSNNLSQISLVAARIELPREIQEDAIKEGVYGDNVEVKEYPLDNVPVLSVSAFDQASYERVQINVSYVINIENDTTVQQYVTPKVKTSSNERIVLRSLRYVCKYFDIETERYLNNGCRPVFPNNTNASETSREVTCECNHTTIFAVLLAVESFTIPREVTILSYITQSFSTLCLLVTLVILIKLRKSIRSDRTIVQINLTLALMFLHFFSLFHDLAMSNDRMCEMITILKHFFILATAFWMFVEAFTLTIKITDRALALNSKNSTKYSLARYLIGWVLPATIVAVAAIAGFATDSYMDEVDNFGFKRCWLNPKNGVLLGSVVIPVALIYFVNLCLLVKVSVFVYQMSKASEKFRPAQEQVKNIEDKLLHIKATFKAIMLLFPVIGVPWIFSFLTGLESYEASVVFMYFNVIFNGLQGLMVLLVYCVFGSEIRKIWLRRMSHSIQDIVTFDKRKRTRTNTMTNLS
ncbi:unnamed protein product [Clavelina lepadiformis]|uniref:G-protein coupled receptors family 2 profile 2 domain-containing protein n=1 Tax=Clavelina lepadiformis TaxID=159417 RepID=A0ABP0FNR3_CLALP